jgi:hypothetical protein
MTTLSHAESGRLQGMDVTADAKREQMRSGQAAKEEEGRDGADVDKSKSKKRRRVVVACDTCRRKKVKCEGLPNASNTCNNCENMGYACAFTVETDRSRGRYEILESQKDTLLAALKSVAPELASQFEKGELHITSPSGTGNNNGMADRNRVSLSDVHSTSTQAIVGMPASHMETTVKREANPMVPDMEDGRPRYYGGSSSLHSFNEIDSRPPSPSLGSRRPYGDAAGLSGNSANAHEEGSSFRRPGNAQRTNFAVLPSPMPQFPRNSIEWVRELRRKTLVAVGRDEIYATEGWFDKYALPSSDLLNELLDYYFDKLHALLPILHEYTLRRDLGMGRAERDSAFRGLIFTVITIASRFFKHDSRVWAEPNVPESAGDHWAAASRFHHQVYAASLINVQVSLLSCAFMPSHLGIGTSWTVLGVAVRACLDVGLHSERAYVGYTSFEQERRRRTFWAAFCLDAILSINMGRPLAIRPSDISVNMPLLASEDAMSAAERSGGRVEEMHPSDETPCVVAGFIHLIKACTLVRDTLVTIYQPTLTNVAGGNSGMGYGAKPSPSYKDMTVLCKRLDEWVANTPKHLQDIRQSPYPVQAAFLHCGRNNVRLYILKPFLYTFRPDLSSKSASYPANDENSILRKMLLPQCTSHARATLSAVKAINDDVGVPVNYFLMHQSFLSASTFILTVWHGTQDLELLRSDNEIIQFALKMYNNETKYASVLLQRAHRILKNVAVRALTVISDEEQRKKLQDLLRRSGGGAVIAPTPLPPHTNVVRDSLLVNSQSPRNSFSALNHSSSPLARTSRQCISHLRNERDDSHSNSPQQSALQIAFSPDLPFKDGIGDVPIDTFDVQQWLPSSIGTPVGLHTETDALSTGFQFDGDMSWTDYFTRFLGGLPEPVNSSTVDRSKGLVFTPEAISTPK